MTRRAKIAIADLQRLTSLGTCCKSGTAIFAWRVTWNYAYYHLKSKITIIIICQDMKVNFRISNSYELTGGPKEYYTLECLYFFARNLETDHSLYVRRVNIFFSGIFILLKSPPLLYKFFKAHFGQILLIFLFTSVVKGYNSRAH